MIVKMKWESSDKDWYFANKNVDDGTAMWAGKILDISNSSEAINENKEYEVSGISVLIDDTPVNSVQPGPLRTKMAGSDKYILGDNVTLYDNDDNIVYKGKIQNWDWPSRNAMFLELSDRFMGFRDVIPKNQITLTEYSEAATESAGAAIPIVYGNINSDTGALKCWLVQTTGSRKYLVSDHHIESIDKVFEEDANGVMTEIAGTAWSWANDTDDGRAYVTYAGGTKNFIHVDVQGTLKSWGKFDATNSDYVSVSNFTSHNETTCQAKFRSSDNTNLMSLFGFNGNSSNGLALNVDIAGTKYPALILGANNYKFWNPITDYLDGNWHVLSLYISGGDQADIANATLTIDGVEIEALASDATGASTAWGDFIVGNPTYGSLTADIDWVRVYNTDQLEDDDRWLVWEFTEGTGTTIYDLSGANRDGTLTTGDGTAFWADVALMTDPVDCLRTLIDDYTTMEYDAAAMVTAQTTMEGRSYVAATAIAIFNDFDVSLQRFAFTFDCDFYVKQNRLFIDIIDYSSITPSKYFYFENMIDYSVNSQPELLANKIKYMYGFDWAINNFQKRPIESNSDSISNWDEHYQVLDMRFTYDDSTAADSAQRYIIQRKNPPDRGVMLLFDKLSSDINLTDLISVRNEIGINSDEVIYRVNRISKNFMQGVIAIEAFNFNALSGAVIRFGEEGVQAATWTDATDSDRNYGYFCDTDGYFSNDVDPGKVFY